MAKPSIRLVTLGAALLALSFLASRDRSRRKVAPAGLSPEELLDKSVEYTFPASDPPAVEYAYRMALQRWGE